MRRIQGISAFLDLIFEMMEILKFAPVRMNTAVEFLFDFSSVVITRFKPLSYHFL